jgi:hypothetical protein
MSELISRQDAIFALLEKGQQTRRYKLGEIWELNFDEMREALATVPSAEPMSDNTIRNEADELKSMPTIDSVPLSAVRKAAKKLAYIHQRIDLYGDRPDLHEEEYWLEYLMDEEWKDPDIE